MYSTTLPLVVRGHFLLFLSSPPQERIGGGEEQEYSGARNLDQEAVPR